MPDPADKIELAEDVIDEYADWLIMATREEGFTLFFGTVGSALDLQEEEVTEGTTEVKAILRMSPQFTKKVLQTLKVNIQEYEDEYGYINVQD